MMSKQQKIFSSIKLLSSLSSLRLICETQYTFMVHIVLLLLFIVNQLWFL